MTPAEALEIVTTKHGHTMFRDRAERPGFATMIVRLAHQLEGLPEPPESAVVTPRLPSFPRRAATFARAAAAHVAAGMPAASPELKAARLAVCQTCPERLPSGICAGCGCVLNRKAGWADQTCPLGKWPE